MTKQYYSKQELFALRNHIPINRLIESLSIPVKTTDGYFRFCCPQCGKQNTAVNPETNLARCFSCSRNYNPIDLVMVVKGLNFVQSVSYLKPFMDSPLKNPSLDIISTRESTPASLASIKTIIKRMNLPTNSLQKQDHPAHNTPVNIDKKLTQRIDNLEQQISDLKNKLSEIEQLFTKS